MSVKRQPRKREQNRVQEAVERLKGFAFSKPGASSKACPTCGLTKPVEQFFRSQGRLDGYSSQCKDCLNAKRREWAHQNPDHMRTIWAEDKRRRRAALKHSIPYLDDSSFSEVIKAFNGACAYCGSTDRLYQDHFYPVGTSRPNNAILPTCAKCNSSKNNREFTEWFPKQTFYSSDRAAAIYRFLFEQRAT